MTPVIVTGGAGYIGSHVCKALHKAGFYPVSVDNLLRGHRSAVKWGPLEEVTIFNTRVLADIMARYKPVAVLHFAGLAYVGESVEDPALYYGTNVTGTLSVLNAMREAGVQNLIFSSSCAVFGDTPEIAGPDTPHDPISPYGRSKSMCEQIIKDFEKAYGEPYACIIRYFNAAGADPELEIGECHEPETHLIPLAIRAAMGKTKGLVVFGSNYPTYDGTQVRDYIHVQDLADFHVETLINRLKGAYSFTANLGRGYGYSILEVLDTVAEVVGKKVPHTFGDGNPADPPFLVCNDLGISWKPKYDLRAMIEHAYAWEQKKGEK